MPVEIKDLIIKNYKNVDYMEIHFKGKVTTLIGPNKAGKSSVNDAFNFLIKGKQAVPLKHRTTMISKKGTGAKVSATIEYNGNRFNLSRTMTDKDIYELKIISEDPAIKLNVATVFNMLFFNPNYFSELNPKQQALELIPDLDIDIYLNEMKDEKKKYTEINTNLKTSESKMLTYKDAEKIEKVDIIKQTTLLSNLIEIINEQKALDNHLSIAYLQQHFDKMFDDLLFKERKELMQNFIDNLVEPDYKDYSEQVLTINKKLKEANKINEDAAKYDKFLEIEKEILDYKTKLELCKKTQEVIEKKQAKYIKSKKLPYDNISINDDGELMFLIDDKFRYLHKDYFSQAEIILIAATFLSGLDIEFKTMFIDNASLLDANTKKKISDLPDVNIIYEEVGLETTNDTSILIMDCHVVSEKKSSVIKPIVKKTTAKKKAADKSKQEEQKSVAPIEEKVQPKQVPIEINMDDLADDPDIEKKPEQLNIGLDDIFGGDND